jgi:DNA-binding GntR family transcriptional regulator
LSRQRVVSAYQQLRELIVAGRLSPGMRLVETELARRLGFSRTPIRGALRVLLREGYVVGVDDAKRRRLMVAPLSAADSRELFGIVGAIEGLGASAAARLPDRKRRRLAAELRGFDETLLSAAREDPPDSAEIFDLFTRFHLRYIETAAGPRLRRLHDSIKPQAERYRRLYSMGDPEERVAASVLEHAAIVDAIANGDPEAARAAVEQNWQNAAHRLASAIEAAGGDGALSMAGSEVEV